jgi:hypothetical protein
MHSNMRNAYLDALGIDRWVRRNAPADSRADAPSVAIPIETPAQVSRPDVRAPAVAPRPALPADIDWGPLREAVAACTACELSKTRTQTVFGVGNQRAEWLVIGEAPGAGRTGRVNPSWGAQVHCSMPCCSPSACRAKPCSSPTS